jgi:hypothetical protein
MMMKVAGLEEKGNTILGGKKIKNYVGSEGLIL